MKKHDILYKGDNMDINSKIKKFLFPTEEENEKTDYIKEKEDIGRKTPLQAERDLLQRVQTDTYDIQGNRLGGTNDFPLQNQQKFKSSSPIVFSPKLFAEAEEIANKMMSGNDVIVNLETLLIEAKKCKEASKCSDKECFKDATRLMDFLCGVAQALHVEVKRINEMAFLFSNQK